MSSPLLPGAANAENPMTMRDTTSGQPTREDVVRVSRSWIGTPYHHQASRKNVGTDCLGLVRGVWRELYGCDAETPPPYAADWAEASGEETMLAAAYRHLQQRGPKERRPGDVLIFRYRLAVPAKHCGILTEQAAFVHAMEGGPVCEIALSPWWTRRIAGVFSFPNLRTQRDEV